MRGMRILRWIAVMAALALAVSGCLGAGGGGGVSTQPAVATQVSGQVYFAERQLYGGIAVVAKNAAGTTVATTYTGNAGIFSFQNLAAGIYSLTATTGDSETLFATGLQIGADQPVQVPETSLLAVKEAYFDRITSSSVRLVFKSNTAAVSQISYGASTLRTTVSASAATSHSIEVTGLASNTYYDFTIHLQTTSGQRVTRSGLGTWTASGATPTNLSISINSGAYESHSSAVTVYLRASGATQMRVGQKADLSDALLETYATSKSITLSGPDGTKTVYAQFRDASGNVSPILNASIFLATGKEGYLGVWIENGATAVTSTNVLLNLLYPGADKMQVANDAEFTVSYWERYTQYRRWNLPSGDGTKTVYARFSGTGIDSSLVFSASTLLSTPTETASGTASGTTGISSSTVDPDVLTDMIIGRNALPTTNAENISGKTFTLMLEGDSIQLTAAVIERGSLSSANGPTIIESSPIWTVNGITGGNEAYGTIDSLTGAYKTPNARPAVSKIEIRATSQNQYSESGATSVRSASIYIDLQDFWKPRKDGMKNDAGRDIPVYCLIADPIWQSNEDYFLFAGTNGNGVWWARVDSTVETDAATFTWNKSGLASTALITPLSHIVNSLAINTSNHDIAAATEDGVFILGGGIRDYSQVISIASGATKGIAWDRHNPDYLYITQDFGIDRIFQPYTEQPVKQTFWLKDYYTATKMVERTNTFASPPVPVQAYPNNTELLYTGTIRSLNLSFSDPNLLYFGTENGEFGYIKNAQKGTGPLVWQTNQPVFDTETGASRSFVNGYWLVDNNSKSLSPPNGIITDISVDPNSPWTMLVSSSVGAFRSINKGVSFTSLGVVTGINARGTLIDPTNVTYFFVGAEDGLFRSKDAGATWTKISSGLGGQLTVNCFTQSEGPPGSKRRIWVGTTGGVYAGAKSLDLY